MSKNYNELFPDAAFARQFADFCTDNGLDVNFETGEGLNVAFRTFNVSGKLKPLDDCFVSGRTDVDYQQLFRNWKRAVTEETMLVFKDGEQQPRLMYYDGGRLTLSEPLDEIWARALQRRPEEPKEPQKLRARPAEVPAEPEEPERPYRERPRLGWFKRFCHRISRGRWFKADYDEVVRQQDEYDHFEQSEAYRAYLRAREDFEQKSLDMENYIRESEEYSAQKEAYDAELAAYTKALEHFEKKLSPMEKNASFVLDRMGEITVQYAEEREAELARQVAALNEALQASAREKLEERTVFERAAIDNFKEQPVTEDNVEARLNEIFSAAEKAIGMDGSIDRADFILCNGEPLTGLAAAKYEEWRRKDWPEDYKAFRVREDLKKERDSFIAELVKEKIRDGVKADPLDNEFVAVYPPNAELQRENVPQVLNIGYTNENATYVERLEVYQPQLDSRDGSLKKIEEGLVRTKLDVETRREERFEAERKATRAAEVAKNREDYGKKISACVKQAVKWAAKAPGEDLLFDVGKQREQRYVDPRQTTEAERQALKELSTGAAAQEMARSIEKLLDQRFAGVEKTLNDNAEMTLDRCDFIYINGRALSVRLTEYSTAKQLGRNVDPNTVGVPEPAGKQPGSKEIAAALASSVMKNYHVEIYAPSAALEVEQEPLTLKASELLDSGPVSAVDARAEVIKAQKQSNFAPEQPAPEAPHLP